MIYGYDDLIAREKAEDFEPGFMDWAHEHGFIAGHAAALGIDESNYSGYVSDRDAHKGWPHNSWTKMWVNDKLTLKYVLQGTEWENLIPKYYYYSLPGKGLRSLCDNPNDATFGSFARTLREVGAFACKPNNGTASNGFHCLNCDSAGGGSSLTESPLMRRRSRPSF